MKVTVIPIVIGTLGTVVKEEGTEGIGEKGKNRDHLDHGIVKIS